MANHVVKGDKVARVSGYNHFPDIDGQEMILNTPQLSYHNYL